MNFVLSEVDNVWIMVRNDYWLIDKYKKLGFKYQGDYDDNFKWYFREK